MIPLWLKIAYTAFVAILVPIYAKKWGWGNFLWFSDIALILMVPALWLESPLLVSMMTVGVLIPETFWNISFFLRLLTGVRFGGLTDYMFHPGKPLWLRVLSLFHVFLPVMMVWMIAKVGYDPNALWAQTLLAWIVLLLCYFFTDPKENINWVYGPGNEPQKRLHPLVYLSILMALFLVAIFLPTHLIFRFVFDHA
jgi:hypothetical protein